RCQAIYLGMAIGGAVGVSRRVRPLPSRWLVLAAIPIGVDGISQLLMLRTSNTALRIATGLPWGLALALFAVPLIREGLAEAAADIEARLAREGPLPSPTA